MKSWKVLAPLITLLLLLGVVVIANMRNREVGVAMMQQGMEYEVVTSAHDQERGLSGRTQLPDNYAMLFAFDESDKYGFWMKDMLIPIDIVWVTETGTVVAVDANVSPATYPKAFYPPVPVKYVVETRAGLASVKGWKVGSHISLPPPHGR